MLLLTRAALLLIDGVTLHLRQTQEASNHGEVLPQRPVLRRWILLPAKQLTEPTLWRESDPVELNLTQQVSEFELFFHHLSLNFSPGEDVKHSEVTPLVNWNKQSISGSYLSCIHHHTHTRIEASPPLETLDVISTVCGTQKWVTRQTRRDNSFLHVYGTNHK